MSKLLAAQLVVVVTLYTARSAQSALLFTDTTNITVANTQVEVGGDTTDNPDVTLGMGGTLAPYVEGGTNAYGCCGGRLGTFGIANLNDGDVGIGNPSDGTYAIPDAGPGAVVLDFGTARLLAGIAIYNGYGNRDNGTYTLLDGASNVLGAWTVSATGGSTNAGVDSFWLTFNTPVFTDMLVLNTTSSDAQNTNSFREIQVFQAIVPEPAGVTLWALFASGACGYVVRRRKRRMLSFSRSDWT